MQANYDPIAKYYDPLSRIIFGDSIRRAHQFLLEAIPSGSNILIVGGGTGWILEDIARQHNSGLNITYVEQSVKMMELSLKRDIGNNKVKFECQSIQNVILKGFYNVIILPFLLDNYTYPNIDRIIRKIESNVTEDGNWMIADFTLKTGNLWKKIMLKMMYGLLGPLCNLETYTLPDAEAFFLNNDYQVVHQDSFFSGFICSIIYQKAKQNSNKINHKSII
ncbi:MAG TPA: hypothetical protein VK921_07255 [Anditalea sp.]|nr:hypothetical protein [Anditalea sp.]